VPESNQVDVALWSRDALGRLTTAGESLKAGVQKHLQARRTMCTYVEMVDGTTYYFLVYLAVSLQRGFFTTTVFSNLQTAVQNFFNSALVMPGKDLRINELFKQLNRVAGVYSVAVEDIVGTLKQEFQQMADGAAQSFSFLFSNPLGQEIVPESVQVVAGTQTASGNGTGGFVGDVDPLGTNTVQFGTGRVTVTFANIPPANTPVTAQAQYFARLEWEEDLSLELSGATALDGVTDFNPIIKRPPFGVAYGTTLDFYMPAFLLPLQPGRCYFIGGYNPNNVGGGALPWGSQKLAYDDGEGNIVGDVDPTGINTIDYRTGRVRMTWTAGVFPGGFASSYVATLTPNADGVTKDFTFQVPGWPMVAPVGFGQGLLRLDFSGYPNWGTEANVYDNTQNQWFGTYLDNRGDSTFDWTTGQGVLHFETPPQSPGVPPHTVPFHVGPNLMVIYSAFVFYVKTPAAPGHDLYWFADNTGKIWGTTPDAYPTTRLDHKTGHYVGRLSSPVASGRTVGLRYDAFLRSDAKNIPIGPNAIATFGRTVLRQLEEEIDL